MTDEKKLILLQVYAGFTTALLLRGFFSLRESRFSNRSRLEAYYAGLAEAQESPETLEAFANALVYTPTIYYCSN